MEMILIKSPLKILFNSFIFKAFEKLACTNRNEAGKHESVMGQVICELELKF